MDKKISEFLEHFRASFSAESFIKLALTNYKGIETDLKKVTVREISLKGLRKLSFTYTYKTRDIVKNYDEGDAILKVTEFLKSDFKDGTLLTTEFDLSFPSLKKSKASVTEKPDLAHDRSKHRHVTTEGKKYLVALKLTDAQGQVLKSAQDKYKQIDKYIEIISGLIKDFPKEKCINIVDMGSGKGYLTFALYDYLWSSGYAAKVTGVEYRQDMVDLCNNLAKECAFENLDFKKGGIADYQGHIDILIALHACDTATDDAIEKGITAGAKLIVVAPCCHKQIRKQMDAANKRNDLNFLLKYGTFMERQAEMVTDGLRALILNHFGYSAKIFEFISDSHTPKNVMIVASKNEGGVENALSLQKIKEAKDYFGITKHHLEEIMGL